MVSRMYLLNKMTEEDSEIHALSYCQFVNSLALCISMIARTRRRRPGEGQPVAVQASRRPGCEQGERAPGAAGELPSRCRPRLSPFRPLLRVCDVCVYVWERRVVLGDVERRTVVLRRWSSWTKSRSGMKVTRGVEECAQLAGVPGGFEGSGLHFSTDRCRV